MIKVDNPQLLASGHKYRKDLLIMPIVQLEGITKHMTLRFGVRGKESVGQFGNGAEMSPYNTAKTDSDFKDTTSLDLRELETFIGEVLERFDPVVLSSTAFGNQLATPVENFDIVKATVMAMAASVGGSLRKNLFKAKRNSKGKKTVDLFDGFSTIADRERAAGAISTEAGNLKNLPPITAINACDELLGLYLSSCDEFQELEQVKMFVPTSVYNAYTASLQAELGYIVHHKEYSPTFLHGSNGKCELVSCSSMAGTNQIHLSTRGNMLVGCDQLSDAENVLVRQDNIPTLVQFYMNAYFGVQFETISKERLMIGQIATE